MIEYRRIGMIAAGWGVAGVVLLLASAIYRLTPLAVEALASELQWYHWTSLLAVLFFMAYFEGYQAFQLGFSPRVAARARYLISHRNLLHALLAPLFCMAFFHAPRRRRITAISVTTGIIFLVLLLRYVPQPWRGIVDAGVVVGLAWGLVSLIVFSVQALSARAFEYSPEVPEAGGRGR